MYNGEVFIIQEELKDFFETGKELQVKGLFSELHGAEENYIIEENTNEENHNIEERTNEEIKINDTEICSINKWDVENQEKIPLSNEDSHVPYLSCM